ncbi:MAG: 3-oxoacyl-ACP reductase FabG [SAR324 cluster bacterium]|nr:3-oxoacyl-ACP reductase FabG [SAR324 cluster bacterium]
MELQGQVALVTGGGQGIGAETARQLAAQGAKIVVADWNEETAAQCVEELRGAGGEAVATKADVSKQGEAERIVELAVREFGRLDILINNAGITRDSSLLKMEPHQWDQVIAVNLSGVYYCAQAAARQMREQQYGRIVSASSISAFGNFGQTNYAATKAGVVGMTKSMAIELAHYGITVNAIAPGFIQTAMTSAIPNEMREATVAAIPVGRAGDPNDIARVYVFLSLPESSFITGQLFVIDGGRTLGR